MSNRMYDRLRFLALVFLPALGTFYFTMASVWGLPAAEQVVGSIVAFDTFLGLVLKLAARPATINAGELHVIPTDVGRAIRFEMGVPPEVMESQSRVIFDIKHADPHDPPADLDIEPRG